MAEKRIKQTNERFSIESCLQFLPPSEARMSPRVLPVSAAALSAAFRLCTLLLACGLTATRHRAARLPQHSAEASDESHQSEHRFERATQWLQGAGRKHGRSHKTSMCHAEDLGKARLPNRRTTGQPHCQRLEQMQAARSSRFAIAIAES
jgi:hypothetical protein